MPPFSINLSQPGVRDVLLHARRFNCTRARFCINSRRETDEARRGVVVYLVSEMCISWLDVQSRLLLVTL